MRKPVLLALLLLWITIFPASAQDAESESPLLRMLARIPDTPAARDSLTYVDYRALIAARPGAPLVEDWQAFESIMDRDGADADLLMGALMGVQSGPAFFGRYFMEGGAMSEIVGFDPFTIARAAEYGQPPDTVTILEGNFDADAVIAAHEARGYTVDESADLTLLCASDGCDTGNMMNLRDRNPANPFGGDLGRSQPVLLGESIVASSPSLDALNGAVSAIAGDKDSLADNPDYRAAAEALAGHGAVLQAYFVEPSLIAPLSAAIANPRLSPEALEALRERLQAEFVPMPFYHLAVLADSATDAEQVALVALVFASEADAQSAADLFPARLEQYVSLAVQQPFAELLADRGVTSIDAEIIPASTGRSVLVLALHAPLPADEDEDGRTPASSLVYSLLVRAYMQRDLGWLATQF